MSPHKSSVPTTPSPLLQFQRKVYADKGIQTDPEPEEPEEPEKKWPTVIPGYENWEMPHMRRIRIYKEWERKDNIKKEELKKKIEAGLCSPFATIVPTWLEERRADEKRRAERRGKEAREKEEEAAAAAAAATVSPSSDMSHSTNQSEESKSGTPASVIQLPPPPLPSQAAHTLNNLRPPNGQKLQLSTLPPVPPFTNATSSGTQASAAFTPTPTTPSAAQSPFGYVGSAHSYPGLTAGTVGPSPVKKKLSLGDYMSRRGNLTTPTVEKTQAQATGAMGAASSTGTIGATTSPVQIPSDAPAAVSGPTATMIKPDDSIKIEAKALGAIEGSAVLDPLRAIKDASPTSPSASIPALAQLPNPPPSISPELSSVLSNLQALAGNAARRDSSAS
jgi:hypothetical protein